MSLFRVHLDEQIFPTYCKHPTNAKTTNSKYRGWLLIGCMEGITLTAHLKYGLRTDCSRETRWAGLLAREPICHQQHGFLDGLRLQDGGFRLGGCAAIVFMINKAQFL
ncbi:hypothetical protein CEXT_742311 [Caerostris extrusa]|uniref:Uncharacterized protein n=1 Tax=Caerostris extrusa TaxID=172846 RepID=A0AAV4TVH8_CAEEX|nr:hypothetical protein CEXT_742311 [Caerostris extrusa]